MHHKNILLVTLLSSLLLFAEEKNPFDSLSLNKIKEQNKTLLSEVKKQEKKPIKTTQESIKKSSKQRYNLDEISIELKEGLKGKTPLLLKLKNKRFLKKLYQQNNHTPLWITKDGFGEKVSSLFRLIEADLSITTKTALHQEYLYLVQQMKKRDQKEDKLRIELKLSQLYLDFLKHTLYGRINWKQFSAKLAYKKRKRVYGNWVRYKAPYDLIDLMQKENIDSTIKEITPHKFGYAELQKALKKLLVLKEKKGWEKLPIFKRLELGDQGDNVIKLRERLEKSGDLKTCDLSPKKLFEKDESEKSITFQPRATFDLCLNEAVKRFQKRHGLTDDGIVGPGTIRAMNQTVEQKIQKVLLNLDRIKWLPRNTEERYLIVNIPEYMLHYIEKNKVKEKIRVIVGDKKHPTPIFNNKISFIVLNPYWKVPEGIVKREIIPSMIKDPGYLRKQGLEIHERWSEYSPKIAPESIYWEQYRDGYIKFPYRIMQPPGKKNALGKIKFKFPNRFDVYLHDTPTKYLFKRDQRAFSHGCVRISQPKKLLKTIATFNTNIKLKKAESILKGRRQRQINIEEKLPITILYLTAGFNNETNELEFRDDIYHYDKMQNIDKY